MAGRVHRITLFKLPKEEDRQKLLEQYKVVNANAKKVSKTPSSDQCPRRRNPSAHRFNTQDGKPYILSLAAGPAEPDQRSQGFTLVSKSEFASLDDMKYYDDECEAHQALKAYAKKELTLEGIMTVYFTPQVLGGVSP